MRVLAERCSANDVALTSTGFLAAAENNRAKARAQFREEALKEAGHITDRSHTYARRLEEISSGTGQAYKDLKCRGPFHVINIDACGSIAKPSANHAQRMLDAIYRLIELQLEISSGGWLLFVTTDVTSDSISKHTMQLMCEAIEANAQKNDEFATGTKAVLSTDAISVSDAIEEAESAEGEQFVRLFALSFAKWILHMAQTKNWGVKMKASYFYSTAPGRTQPTMPCLAFEFLPPSPGLLDAFGVTNAAPTKGNDVPDLEMAALAQVREMADLDELVAGDSKLRERLIAETKLLLEEAGYAATALARIGADENALL